MPGGAFQVDRAVHPRDVVTLDAAQLTDTGQLLRRALDLRPTLAMGIRIGLDVIDADEFLAMRVVEQERDAYDRGRMKQN
jgi:hypothetical protein